MDPYLEQSDWTSVHTTNKRDGGRAECLAKRNKVLRSDAHLLAMDLLRSGQRMPMDDPPPHARYFVVVSRAERRPLAKVWPVHHLRSRLPIVSVRPRIADSEVSLDLQSVLTSICNLFGLGVNINYRQLNVAAPAGS